MITTDINILRTKSLPFTGTKEELDSLIKVLEYELAHSVTGSGAGLAAIQINLPFRVAILRTKNLNVNLVNAKIIRAEQPFVNKGEGCLSYPGVRIDTNRYNLVTIENEGKESTYSGFDAVLVSHEIGHFDGDVFLDHKTEE